jgi:microcystin-dependent protein
MSDQFVAEIRMFAGNFAPTGFAQCDGQLLPISQNTALFSLLGTFYGGDGKSTFALPDLQGSVPIGSGQGQGLSERFLGESSGSDYVTLLTSEMPIHSHVMQGLTDPGDNISPVQHSLARSPSNFPYQTNAPQANVVNLAFEAVGVAGGSLPHNNIQPSLVITFIIALQGIFPARP